MSNINNIRRRTYSKPKGGPGSIVVWSDTKIWLSTDGVSFELIYETSDWKIKDVYQGRNLVLYIIGYTSSHTTLNRQLSYNVETGEYLESSINFSNFIYRYGGSIISDDVVILPYESFSNSNQHSIITRDGDISSDGIHTLYDETGTSVYYDFIYPTGSNEYIFLPVDLGLASYTNGTKLTQILANPDSINWIEGYKYRTLGTFSSRSGIGSSLLDDKTMTCYAVSDHRILIKGELSLLDYSSNEEIIPINRLIEISIGTYLNDTAILYTDGDPILVGYDGALSFRIIHADSSSLTLTKIGENAPDFNTLFGNNYRLMNDGMIEGPIWNDGKIYIEGYDDNFNYYFIWSDDYFNTWNYTDVISEGSGLKCLIVK